MFVTLKKTNFIEYFVLKPFSERRQREQGKPLKFSKGGEEEAQELCRGCRFERKSTVDIIDDYQQFEKT